MNSRIKLFQTLHQFRAVATKASADVDLNALKLHVGNIPWTVSKRELQNYFSQFGPIARAEVIFNKETGVSRGFGYVTFEMSKSYVKALKTERHMLEGKLLQINQAKHDKALNDHDSDIY